MILLGDTNKSIPNINETIPMISIIIIFYLSILLAMKNSALNKLGWTYLGVKIT
tara:strand:- start:1737 stop:1898 length:162 start_codon:yes stop_codon:yes gene_type:complete